MSFQRQVSQALDDEHRATLEFLSRLQGGFARATPRDAPADTGMQRLAATLAEHLQSELARHFEFEEREIFPRMEQSGDGDMARLMLEEHDTIRAVCGDVVPLARAATAGTLDGAGWQALQRGALELAERLVAHIDKETMALLPLVDDLLDADTDRELAFAYSAG